MSEEVKPFELGEKVTVAGQGEGTIHQVFDDGAVLEIAVPTIKYVTVSKDIVSRGN